MKPLRRVLLALGVFTAACSGGDTPLQQSAAPPGSRMVGQDGSSGARPVVPKGERIYRVREGALRAVARVDGRPTPVSLDTVRGALQVADASRLSGTVGELQIATASFGSGDLERDQVFRRTVFDAKSGEQPAPITLAISAIEELPDDLAVGEGGRGTLVTRIGYAGVQVDVRFGVLVTLVSDDDCVVDTVEPTRISLAAFRRSGNIATFLRRWGAIERIDDAVEVQIRLELTTGPVEAMSNVRPGAVDDTPLGGPVVKITGPGAIDLGFASTGESAALSRLQDRLESGGLDGPREIVPDDLAEGPGMSDPDDLVEDWEDVDDNEPYDPDRD